MRRVRIDDPGGFYDRMEGEVVRRQTYKDGGGGSYPVVRFDDGDEIPFTDNVLETVEGEAEVEPETEAEPVENAFAKWWDAERWGDERERNAAWEGFRAGWKLALTEDSSKADV